MSKLDELKREEELQIINSAPKVEPISGMIRSDTLLFEGNAVYLTDHAYDAFTLPIYDDEDESFTITKIDMDDDFRCETMFLCYLEELRGRDDFELIKQTYGIK